MLSLPQGTHGKLHPKGKYFRLPSSCGALSSTGTGTASGPSLVCPSNMWESASPSWGWQMAVGREGKRKKSKGRGKGRREKGRRENVIRKREKGKKFIKDSFCELQIFFTCSFQSLGSPFPATLLSSRGLLPEGKTPCHVCVAFCTNQWKMPHWEDIPSTSSGRAVSSKRACTQENDPVL